MTEMWSKGIRQFKLDGMGSIVWPPDASCPNLHDALPDDPLIMTKTLHCRQVYLSILSFLGSLQQFNKPLHNQDADWVAWHLKSARIKQQDELKARKNK